ncbi:hypothetical protein PsorP6_009684 [Peronosclerospora sorghi]|uniref:Uncharacterized protein n=1 Tax=Peronosclerospora sorghi TaxID=230839 RepID=A0ACC0VZJ2_9STRA|nr:hypothetical protein PsorP6_009684 [Peronosclerospora sorghi]
MLSVRRVRSSVKSPSRWLNGRSSSSLKPSSAYDTLVKRGDIIYDAQQVAILSLYLDKLHFRLNGYTLPMFEDSQVATSTSRVPVMVPRGLYVYGGVGTGKSMLLDLFFNGANVEHKRRVHFNEFMLEVQTRVASEKKKQLEKEGRQRHILLGEARDVVVQVAHSIADVSHLLCFDEFQVTDVADALMMRKLFGVMFARGVVMVATSNTSPQDLYQNGTNRDYFLPLLDQLARHTKVVSVESQVDYRFLRDSAHGNPTFFSPHSSSTEEKMDKMYQNLLAEDSTPNSDGVQDELLRVPVMMGRSLDVRGCIKSGVCRASFHLLCETEKGAADYKALAECFHTLVLDHVPAMSMAHHNQARRFILLIDELYEHRTRLVLSSEAAEPRGIFLFDDESVRGAPSLSNIEQEKQRVNKANKAVGLPSSSSWDAPVGAYSPSQITGLNVSNLVALKDLKIAFQRAVSRLHEMQGTKYHEENIRWRLERAKTRLAKVVRV